MEGFDQVVFLKNVAKNPQVIVGDYIYFDNSVG